MIDLGGFMYDITADEPMSKEVINLQSHIRDPAQERLIGGDHSLSLIRFFRD